MTDSESGPRAPSAGIAAELGTEGFADAEEIGHGGFGVVFRCRERALDRMVAVKVLSANLDDDSRSRFFREQRALGKLSGHPNIVSAFHAGVTASGLPYIAMPYHPQDTLDSSIRCSGPVGWREALRIGVKLSGALEAAHRAGILHRDIKPANVLLTEYGEPQLSDFGIARIAGAFETGTGAITGSPAFIAPEVLAGQPPTVASELYSLGATLFCLITGHAAFERRAGEQVVAQFLRITAETVPVIPREGIPDDVCAAVEQAMARAPSSRPSSAGGFGEQLRALQRRHGLPVDDMSLPRDPGQSSPTPPGDISATHPGMPTQLDATPRSTTGRPNRPTETPPPSARTKYRPPTPTRALVERGRLMERLREAQHRRLILIHGPAGFGKSTLAAQWRDVLVAEGAPVAWLNIDPDDNNVLWFLTHLLESIRHVRPDLAGELHQVLQERGEDAERFVLTSLIDGIHDSGQPMVVVVEDWHRVDAPATTSAMKFLLDNGCHHLQFVVTSRNRSGLPLARLRVSDELVEIDSAALRFDVAECTRFLVELGGLALRTQDVADLRESTDGWVAALQLASLSLRDHDDPAAFIDHLSGRHRGIAEYLVENVLGSLDPEMLEFLLATSVPERVCGDLASLLAQTSRGQTLLEQVEERNLFLRADEDREWFRYHHLFADYLHRRLARERPDRLTALHRDASRWFGDHGLLGESVDHALAAGDSDRACNLIETDAYRLIEHSQMVTLLGLLTKVPRPSVAHRPRLKLAEGWAHVLLHHPPAVIRATMAEVKGSLARLSPTDASLTPDEILDIRVEASLLEGIASIFEDRITGVDDTVAICLARQDSLRPFVVAAAATEASLAAIYRFDFDGARSWHQRTASFHDQTIGPLIPTYGYCFAGIAAHEQLDIDAADTYLRQGLELAQRSSGRRSYATRLAGAVLGDLRYEQGRLDEAERLLDESYQLGSEGGVVEFMLVTYGTGARIKALGGDLEAASNRLDEGIRVAATLELPRLAARMRNERIRLGLRGSTAGGRDNRSPDAGQPESADLGGRGIGTIVAQLDEDSTIRLLIGEGRPDEACRRAERLLRCIREQHRPRALVRAQLAHLTTLVAAERLDNARAAAIPVLTRCAELGLIRLVTDESPQVRRLVAVLHSDRGKGDPQDRSTLLSAFLERVLRDSSLNP